MSAKEREGMDAEMAALLFGLGRAQIALLELEEPLSNFERALNYYAEAGEVERAVEIGEYPLPAWAGYFPGATNIAERALELVAPDSHEAGRILSNYVGLVGL